MARAHYGLSPAAQRLCCSLMSRAGGSVTLPEQADTEIYQRHTSSQCLQSLSDVSAAPSYPGRAWQGDASRLGLPASLPWAGGSPGASSATPPCWECTESRLAIVCFGNACEWHQLLPARGFHSPVITCCVNHFVFGSVEGCSTKSHSALMAPLLPVVP